VVPKPGSPGTGPVGGNGSKEMRNVEDATYARWILAQKPP
jgi:hypothetical protein